MPLTAISLHILLAYPTHPKESSRQKILVVVAQSHHLACYKLRLEVGQKQPSRPKKTLLIIHK